MLPTTISRRSRRSCCLKPCIVDTIVKKIRRRNFLFREGRRIYFGRQMDTTRLVWARNLCEGWQIDIDGRRITVDCILREITVDGVETMNYWNLAAYRSAAFTTMRTIEVTLMKTVIVIEDWNHATWRLFKETDGMFRYTLSMSFWRYYSDGNK